MILVIVFIPFVVSENRVILNSYLWGIITHENHFEIAVHNEVFSSSKVYTSFAIVENFGIDICLIGSNFITIVNIPLDQSVKVLSEAQNNRNLIITSTWNNPLDVDVFNI